MPAVYINSNLSVREAGTTAATIVLIMLMANGRGLSNRELCQECNKSDKTVATALDLLAERQVAVRTTGGWRLSPVARQMILGEPDTFSQSRKISDSDPNKKDGDLSESENFRKHGISVSLRGGVINIDSNSGGTRESEIPSMTIPLQLEPAVDPVLLADLTKLMRLAGVFHQLIPRAAAELAGQADGQEWVRMMAGHIHAHYRGDYGTAKRGAAIWPMVQGRIPPPEDAMPPAEIITTAGLLEWLDQLDPEKIAQRQMAEASEAYHLSREKESNQEVSEPASELEVIWANVLVSLKMELRESTFETWVRDTRLESVNGDLYTIEAANAFARDWLDNRLNRSVERTLSHLAGREVRVAFVVRGFHNAGDSAQ